MKHIRCLVVLMLGSIAQGQSQSSWVFNGNLLNLSSVGNAGGYGTFNPQGEFRTVGAYGVNGVFLPTSTGNGSLISTTGLYYKASSDVVSVSPDPPGDSVRSQWQDNPMATFQTWTSSLDNFFTPKGINWASNSLFAGANSGITYDLLEIKTSLGQNLTKFSTYFGNHCEPGGGGDAAFAILLDGILVASERNFTALNPYSDLIEVNLSENTRFLTLVVGDNGDDYNWDMGVFVAPTLTTVPEPSSLSLLGLGGVVVALRRRKK